MIAITIIKTANNITATSIRSMAPDIINANNANPKSLIGPILKINISIS